MLTIEGLTIRTKAKTIVEQLELAIHPGEWCALAGESGSGKSMTAFAIGGLLPASVSAEGIIMWNDENLLALPVKQRRSLLGSEISYIFQDYHGAFTPFLRVGSQLDELMCAHGKQDRKARKQRCIEVLEHVQLPAERVYRSYPFELSGGQLQRAAIAAALLLEPKLLIADEPTTALDTLTAHRVLQLIDQIRMETGISVLWITHDLRHVRKYADRIAVMRTGVLVEAGQTQAVLDHPVHPYTCRLLAAIPPLSPGAPSRLPCNSTDEQLAPERSTLHE
ncbi:ABC transporter ATP-binding protein [Paenibacillus polymyxa]|uniref:ATP-binding cassette domain-containing protein n=1 Tax=Paenibacillus polymyxa TaxID=1406 RepID=UPI000EBABDBA|nr:ABC transporter ATP-binding protein [Paenibacillus polymyxa]RGL30490.1 ABC transporter ATP-binding protein [Paenibacillus polymyxa]UMR33475.1 ABC transporter ATP-binding protein [Paenibacillus polymyxa]